MDINYHLPDLSFEAGRFLLIACHHLNIDHAGRFQGWLASSLRAEFNRRRTDYDETPVEADVLVLPPLTDAEIVAARRLLKVCNRSCHYGSGIHLINALDDALESIQCQSQVSV